MTHFFQILFYILKIIFETANRINIIERSFNYRKIFFLKFLVDSPLTILFFCQKKDLFMINIGYLKSNNLQIKAATKAQPDHKTSPLMTIKQLEKANKNIKDEICQQNNANLRENGSLAVASKISFKNTSSEEEIFNQINNFVELTTSRNGFKPTHINGYHKRKILDNRFEMLEQQRMIERISDYYRNRPQIRNSVLPNAKLPFSHTYDKSHLGRANLANLDQNLNGCNIIYECDVINLNRNNYIDKIY